MRLQLPSWRLEPPESEADPPAGVPVEEWRSADPDPAAKCVSGWQKGGCLHFQFPGFARYVFDSRADLCRASAFAGASEAQLIDTYQRAVLPMILQTRGVEVLHASAIDTGAGVVGFAAISGTGKSTLAAEFGARGYEVWADDALTWTIEAARVVTAAMPFVLRVGNSRPPYLPLATDWPSMQRPLIAAVVMERCEHGELSLSRIARPSEALSVVLPHAYCFSTRDQAASRSLMANYLSLVDALPIYQLRFPSGCELISETADLIQTTLELHGPHCQNGSICIAQ